MDWDFSLSYSAFSFNYTNSCSGNSGIQVAFRNVHGALNQNSNESKIIFGIDNISSDSRAEDIGYRFTKSYRTMRLYTELENDKTFWDKIDNIFTKDITPSSNVDTTIIDLNTTIPDEKYLNFVEHSNKVAVGVKMEIYAIYFM